jgi:hypothetical protein
MSILSWSGFTQAWPTDGVVTGCSEPKRIEGPHISKSNKREGAKSSQEPPETFNIPMICVAEIFFLSPDSIFLSL